MASLQARLVKLTGPDTCCLKSAFLGIRPVLSCRGLLSRADRKVLVQAAKEYNTHLQGGANIAGFLKVAEAMKAQGVF